jgi:hypothetical protein
MGNSARSAARAGVTGLMLLCLAAPAGAQSATPPVMSVAAVATGSISGVVQDERGDGVAGAIVSVLGPTTTTSVTDRGGRFELRTLMPGPYVVRAHLAGFVTSRGLLIDVRSSARAQFSIALRRVTASAPPSPILAAGFGLETNDATSDRSPDAPGGGGDSAESSGRENHGELAWRLRHARRGVLKEVTLNGQRPGDVPFPPGGYPPASLFGASSDLSARVPPGLFSGMPLSGQLKLWTTGSFDTPQQLFSSDSFARSIAFFSVGAPVGEHADWTVHGAVTEGDISSWMVAAAYTTRAPARNQYDAGVSYATQRYDGGNLAALREVADGRRNVGSIYGFESFALAPSVSLSYGARFSRYDYLETPALFSPRVVATLAPVDGLRLDAVASRRALAPGAEEFVPPVNSAIWLPPQRTFSTLDGRQLEAEHADHFELRLERDAAGATLTVRGFEQRVDDQLATLFGIDMPDAPAHLGHYFVANTGHVDVAGWSAGIRSTFADRVHGSVEYTQSRAHSSPAANLGYLLVLAPSVVRSESERVHDLATKVETEVPETSTRILLVFRISNAFASAGDRPSLDSRFDVQIRQALPFMDFRTAKWEMLVAVKNFFRDPTPEASIYDELLVLRPPKRIVGGLTLRF